MSWATTITILPAGGARSPWWVHTSCMGNEPDERSGLQRQVDDLSSSFDRNRQDIEGLQAEASEAHARADAMEARAEGDREMIAELQVDGVVSQEHALHMEEALKSSRKIGAAIGMIMASRMVTEDEAFAILKQASQKSNRKLRELAADLVDSRRLSDV